jgi:SAM-dependent methyltransferase
MVLDLGCGYGRIRRHVVAARPDLRVVGTDFAEAYCRLHRQEFGGGAVCADMRRLPFGDEMFEGIIGVTSLMYLSRTERPELIPRLLRHLKPTGHALFVDPGLEFMRLARVGLRSTRTTRTGGEGFSLAEYTDLGGSALRTLDIGGIGLFSCLLPVLYVMGRRPVTSGLLARIRRCDYAARWNLRYSLQRWVLLGPPGRKSSETATE